MKDEQDRIEEQEQHDEPEAATTERNAAEVELDNAADGNEEVIAEPEAELEAPALEAAAELPAAEEGDTE